MVNRRNGRRRRRRRRRLVGLSDRDAAARPATPILGGATMSGEHLSLPHLTDGDGDGGRELLGSVPSSDLSATQEEEEPLGKFRDREVECKG